MNPLVAFAKNQILDTERLHLRPLNLADLTDYHEYTSDNDLLKYDYPAHTSIDESLEKLVLSNLAQPLGKYGIELKANGKLIGNVTLKYLTKKTDISIGYTINANYHNCGFATEAVQRLLPLLKSTNLKGVVATVDSRNLSSRKVLLKLGFRETNRFQGRSLRQEIITKIKFRLDLRSEALT